MNEQIPEWPKRQKTKRSGGVWVKASERLPKKITDDLHNDKGIVFKNNEKAAVILIYMSVTPNIPALFKDEINNWEWLDETAADKGGAIADKGKEKLYWQQRCLAAEKFIEESPCDPDIYPKQFEAYKIWQQLKNQSTKEEI